jgi:acyl carrier protein
MTVSPRTPEGLPSRCPLCGAAAPIDLSDTGGDAPCPKCGYLLRRSASLLELVQNRLGKLLGISPRDITTDMRLTGLGADSLDVAALIVELLEMDSIDTVDFVIELEEQGLSGHVETVGDLVRYLQARPRG